MTMSTLQERLEEQRILGPNTAQAIRADAADHSTDAHQYMVGSIALDNSMLVPSLTATNWTTNITAVEAPTEKKTGRQDILDTAAGCVLKDRAATHGDLEDSFAHTANLWSAHLGVDISATDVAVMMALLKIARIKSTPTHKDNWVDLAGYAACGGELALRDQD